jgi:hypothetical protein
MTHRSKSSGAVAIAAGAALSSAGNTSDKVLCALIIPAGWTTAALTFQASDDAGVTWNELTDDQGNAITISAAAVTAGLALSTNARMSMDPSNFASVDFIKVRSGTVGTPVNQVAAATISLIYRKYYALS